MEQPPAGYLFQRWLVSPARANRTALGGGRPGGSGGSRSVKVNRLTGHRNPRSRSTELSGPLRGCYGVESPGGHPTGTRYGGLSGPVRSSAGSGWSRYPGHTKRAPPWRWGPLRECCGVESDAGHADVGGAAAPDHPGVLISLVPGVRAGPGALPRGAIPLDSWLPTNRRTRRRPGCRGSGNGIGSR